MLKFFLVFGFIIFPIFSFAKITKKSTAVSVCKRELEIEDKNLVVNKNPEQEVIVAIETDNESKCKITGKARAEQYGRDGWKCHGLKKDPLFTCINKRAAFFAKYKNTNLNHLLFTNLTKHRALIGYINSNIMDTCLVDKQDIEAGGVTDAKCHEAKKKK